MSNQPHSKKANAGPSPDDVVAFLRANPEFFTEHEYLLKEIKLPHASGKAISLVQRQLSLFREQRDKYESQLLDLVDTARENDRFFEKSRRLLMNLLDATSLDEVLIVLQDSFVNDFEVDFCSLLLVARKEDFPVSNLAIATAEEIEATLGKELLAAGKAYCGQLTDIQNELIYGARADKVKSAAVIPVRHGVMYAVLGIGSRDPDYFHSNLDSVFLTYISESLGRILPALMAKEMGCLTLP
jgi:uncharacterized protein